MNGKEKINDRMSADGDTSIFKQNTGDQSQTGENKTDYDSAWKEVIEKLFQPYLATKLHKGTQRKKNGSQVIVPVMIFMRCFPGCDQNFLAKKTRS